jgi:hypothetical protein
MKGARYNTETKSVGRWACRFPARKELTETRRTLHCTATRLLLKSQNSGLEVHNQRFVNRKIIQITRSMTGSCPWNLSRGALLVWLCFNMRLYHCETQSVSSIIKIGDEVISRENISRRLGLPMIILILFI